MEYDTNEIRPNGYDNREITPRLCPNLILDRNAKGEERNLRLWHEKSQTEPRSPAKA